MSNSRTLSAINTELTNLDILMFREKARKMFFIISTSRDLKQIVQHDSQTIFFYSHSKHEKHFVHFLVHSPFPILIRSIR